MKKAALGILVGVLSFSLVGCSQKEESSQLESIKEKGKLVIGTSADYPPYEFHKKIDGKDTVVGFEMEIAKEIAKEIGVELEIKDMKFDGLLPALQSQNIDMVVAGMSPTEERKKAVNFTDVYYNGENAILIKKDDLEKYKTVESLKNIKIGVQKSSIQEGFAKDNIGATNIKSLSKIPDIILELKNSNVDAVVVSKDAVGGYLKEYPEIVFANIDLGQDKEEGSAIATKKSEDYSLIKKTNDILGSLKKENKIQKFVDEATKLSQ
ncbi:transporter substrate-binding domain-containing protein [Romboutsia sedimentorum]|uniref:Transporter substrate-binding domain-containing protein n=1 Tax=Romboutsia sedimentorum TaxID=1368474 RepID=A0ABT7E6D0_9FIRM|nr:transporter substrate-binding domain-containing protein [Romboutsia sedimentorum]MDK2562486.1 transporter substrate-binding domain-containing protein [Romboutsia sedimentorum]MDK2584728.1 transporter substrate-binding domain-containing protein [Romboutsia sedimentorum]